MLDFFFLDFEFLASEPVERLTTTESMRDVGRSMSGAIKGEKIETFIQVDPNSRESHHLIRSVASTKARKAKARKPSSVFHDHCWALHFKFSIETSRNSAEAGASSLNGIAVFLEAMFDNMSRESARWCVDIVYVAVSTRIINVNSQRSGGRLITENYSHCWSAIGNKSRDCLLIASAYCPSSGHKER